MLLRKCFAHAALAAIASLAVSGCGGDGNRDDDADATQATGTIRLVNDLTRTSTADTTVPIAINPLSFSSSQDRTDTAVPIALD